MALRSRSWFTACPMVVVVLFCCGSMLVIFARLSDSSSNTPPGKVQAIRAVAPRADGPLVVFNSKALHLPNRAVIRTSMGDIVLELLRDAAPRHVHNFVSLARSGWYNGTSLYRLEKGFCLQGGGWPTKSGPITVPLETHMYAQHPNKQWAVSAARMSDPDSASAEFSNLLGDNRCDPPPPPSPCPPSHSQPSNSKWLGPGGSDAYGYSVFANVIRGMQVVEAIAAAGNVKAQGGLNYLNPAIPIHSIDA
jgi:peptidyl-prolyl cis-trans isomerase A (cyclophilin A)